MLEWDNSRNMTRRRLLSALAALPALAQQHPVVNLDQHGEDMPAGMDMASDNALRARASLQPGGARPALTRSGGNLRHGVYQDTIFTPDRVVKSPPRKVFTVQLPGDARGLESQPLIVPGVKIAGETHDVMVSSTMGNQIYAHDANDGTPLWMCYLGNPIVGTRKIDGWLLNENWGVLSTGVIDGNTLYVVAWISPDGTPGRGVHSLHAIDLPSGQQSKLPLTLANETIAMQRKQRSSLTQIGRTLYVPWGTIQETAKGAHGFVTAVDLDGWMVTGEWNASPTGSGAGIWMAGQALSSDGQYLYAMTGNGDYDGVKNFGESFVKLDQSLRVVDHWSPFRDSARGTTGGWNDMDLGSGGCIVIPEMGVVLGAGKDGILYTLNKDKLKAGPVQPPVFFTFNGMGLNATPRNAADLNQLFYGKTHHMHSTPIYWAGKLYCWGENGNGRVWSINNTGAVEFLARTAEIASPYSPPTPGGMPGSMQCLSADGDKNGILWAVVPDGDANRQITTGRVFAFDASNWDGKLPDGDSQLRRLWMSDPHHTYSKFNPPVVSGGKLYVPTYNATVEVWTC